MLLIIVSLANVFIPASSKILFLFGYVLSVIISLLIAYKIISFKNAFLGTILYFLLSFFSDSFNHVFASSYPFVYTLIFYLFCRYSRSKSQREFVNLLTPAAMLESDSHFIDIIYSLFMFLIAFILFFILLLL